MLGPHIVGIVGFAFSSGEQLIKLLQKMFGPDIVGIVGFALSSGEQLIKLLQKIHDDYQADKEVPEVLRRVLGRAQRICDSLDELRKGTERDNVPEIAFRSIRSIQREFDEIRSDLEKPLSGNKRGFLGKRKIVDGLEAIQGRLATLEHELIQVGLMEYQNGLTESLTKSIEKLSKEMKDNSETMRMLEGFKKCELSDSCEMNESPCSNVIPKNADAVLDTISRSGFSDSLKRELCDEVEKLWNSWKVYWEDLRFERDYESGQKVVIAVDKDSSSKTHKATYVQHSEDGFPVGCRFQVAVKEFTVGRDQFPTFLREIYLQMGVSHPCVVHSFGGHWPNTNGASRSSVQAKIVCEYIEHNLRDAIRGGLLVELKDQKRVLRDVAKGLTYLHSYRIVHRDLRPENIFIRVGSGKFVGNAKIGNFSSARKSNGESLWTQSAKTADAGGKLQHFTAPELRNGRGKSRPSRDVWSYGVLICAVSLPQHFQQWCKKKHEDKDIGELVQEIPDLKLRNAANKCLILEWRQRSSMCEIIDMLN